MNGAVGQVRIIADGAVLEALKSAFRGDEFSGDHTCPGDTLIVYAPALLRGTTQRSRLAGLQRLQQILADPGSDRYPAEVFVLGLTSRDRLGRYEYLVTDPSPFAYEQLPSTLSPPNSVTVDSDLWRMLQRTASEEELELQCASFRHRLQSVMAAARIYLGAAVVGHLDAATPSFRHDLQRLQELAGLAGAEDVLDAQRMARMCALHQRFQLDYEDPRPEQVRLWVLDDHWDDHGWEMVYGALPLASVTGVKTWEELEDLIDQADSKPTALLLDCNLGPGADVPTGLELLRPIRSRWQDVRIIFATAYDDAALAITSLREGGNVFFAKALNDRMDRRSDDYYRHLLRLLKTHPIENEVSSLWRLFRRKTGSGSAPLTKGRLPQPPAALEPMLRLAFYLLFSQIDDNLWWNGSRWAAAPEHLYRAALNLIKAGFPRLEEKLPHWLAGTLRGGPHGNAPVLFEDFRAVLEYLLNNLRDQTNSSLAAYWARGWPDYWPYRGPQELQTDSTHPGLPPGVPMQPHEVADERGALELIRGVCCTHRCKHPAISVDAVLFEHPRKTKRGTYQDVAFIDDRGEETGWFRAVRAIMPGCQTYASLQEFESARREFSLVLLDVRLPSLEAGRLALERVQRADPSVPILTLSAATQSRAAVETLRNGAIDFISKTLPGERDLAGSFLFSDEFRNKCKLLRAYGQSECRRAWQKKMVLRQTTQWKTGALEDLYRKIRNCSNHRDEFPGRAGNNLPGDPADWGALLADELALPLRIWQQAFWLSPAGEVVEEARGDRLDYRRCYQIRPIDFWRWEHVLMWGNDPDYSRLVRLIAILAGVVVDRLAQWQWCLDSQESLKPSQWGSKITIKDEVGSIGGLKVWELRNDALYPDRPQPVWDEALCATVVGSLFECVSTFAARQGILNWSGGSNGP